LLLAWRSNPLVFQHFTIQSDPLTWEEHLRWWVNRKQRKDWVVLLQEEERTRRVGVVNVSRLDEPMPEIGLYVGEVTLWGHRVGARALQQALDLLAGDGYARCCAGIRAANDRSQRLFEDAGFIRTGMAGEDRFSYEVDLAELVSPERGAP
jgi:RimJ/RimL family protein N-acetyltransferase